MRFPRDRRLADGAVFNALLNSGRRFQAGPVGARVALTMDDGHIAGRLGITVAKRHLKRAVDRNTVKRFIREAFRRHANEMGMKDVLISLRHAPADLRSAQGRANLHAALDRLFQAASRNDPQGPSIDA